MDGSQIFGPGQDEGQDPQALDSDLDAVFDVRVDCDN